MQNAVPNSFVSSAPLAILVFCAVSVGFFLWFLISLLLDGRKARKTRVQVLPIRNSKSIVTIPMNAQDPRRHNDSTDLPFVKKTQVRLRSNPY
jgi:hypothetical protein